MIDALTVGTLGLAGVSHGIVRGVLGERHDAPKVVPTKTSSQMSDTAETEAPAEAARFEKRTGQYVAIRDKIREIEARHEEELKPLKDLVEDLTAWFTEELDRVGAKSVKTTQGTVYQSTRYSASLNDPKAFMDYVIANQSWHLLDRKANSTAVRDFIEQHKSEPPGVKLSALRTVGVRRASDK